MTRRAAVTFCLLTALALAAIGLVSAWRPMSIALGPEVDIELDSAHLQVLHSVLDENLSGNQRAVPTKGAHSYGLPGLEVLTYRRVSVTDSGAGIVQKVWDVTDIRLMLWLPLLAALVYPGSVFVRGPHFLPARHRRARGQCAKCGYDLTGNASGRCPECGTHIGRSGGSDGSPS